MMQVPTVTRSRREALKQIALLGAGACLCPEAALSVSTRKPPAYSPTLSVEVYCWVQHFEAQKISLPDGIEEMLAGTAKAGYRNVELSDAFLRLDMSGRILALLKKYKLRMPTFYAGTTLHEPAAAEISIGKTLDLAKAMKSAGVRAVVTNPSPKPNHQQKTSEELDTQVKYLNRLGAELQKLGLLFMVHHHMPELVDHGREWRYQLQYSDPKLVRCCVDVDWALRGGEDPLAFVRETGARLLSLHLRNDYRGVWMEEFGNGDIDYAPIAAYLREINYAGYLVVELAYEKDTEVTRSLVEDLERSRLYAQRTFGLRV